MSRKSKLKTTAVLFSTQFYSIVFALVIAHLDLVVIRIFGSVERNHLQSFRHCHYLSNRSKHTYSFGESPGLRDFLVGLSFVASDSHRSREECLCV
jgi:hypothetical protein